MIKHIFLALLLTTPQAVYADTRKQGERRTLAGMVYFTNDTPRNRNTFPVELYTRDQRRRVAATRQSAVGSFELTGVRPGKYLLKLTWPPDRCTLWYKVDLTKASKTEITVVMDAACSARNGAARDLPED